MEPKVFRSSSRLCGDAPIAATAVEGSTKLRFIPVLMAVAKRMAGHHVSHLLWQITYICNTQI